MFGRKKQQRIRLANPNYWMIDEYHRHENEGRKTMTNKEEVREMREKRSCQTCSDVSTSIENHPCSKCYGRHANHPEWQPSALFLALEEALSVAADKPAGVKAMTAEEATAILRSLWIDRKTDTALQYAIDAIRRDENKTDAFSAILKLRALTAIFENAQRTGEPLIIQSILDFLKPGGTFTHIPYISGNGKMRILSCPNCGELLNQDGRRVSE